MALPLIIDVNDPQQSGRLQAFDSTGASIEQDLVRGDINLAISIRPVVENTTGERPWNDDFIAGDTFQVAIGTPDKTPTGGTFDLAALASTVTSSSVANPSVITHPASAVTLSTGNTVYIVGHTGSTPDINGAHVITVTDSTHFTIPVNVTVGGTGGNVYLGSIGLTGLAFDISAANLLTALTVAPFAAPSSVILEAPGVYKARWASGVAAPTFVSPKDALDPASFVSVSDVSTATVQIRVIRLIQQPVAYAEPATAFTAAGVTSTVKQAGSGSANKIYAISFNAPGTYGGSYSLNYTKVDTSTATAGVFTPSSTPEAIQTALENLTAVGDFAVSQDDNGIVTIEMTGTQKLSNVPVIAVTNINLLAPLGVSGFIALNTENLYDAFDAAPGEETLDFTLEVRRSRVSGEQSAIYQHSITLKRNLIEGSIVPTNLPSYYTEAQSDARFLNSATAQSANTAFGNFTGSSAAPTFAGAITVRSSLSLAKSGVNSDITELNASGLIVTADSITAANETVDALRITSATDGKAGSFTLVAGVAVVGNSSVTVASVIIVTAVSVSGTRAGNPDIVINSGVGFTATGGTLDASDYNYIVFDIS